MNHTLCGRFITKIGNISDPAACWLWTAKTTNGGYGQFRVGDQFIYAHRFAYEHWVGPIPEGALICHTCDVPACVNPRHLYAGSYTSNARDRSDRLRHRGGKPRKLTPDQVRAIRHDPRSHRALASIYGVDKSTIAAVRQGRSYRTVHG